MQTIATGSSRKATMTITIEKANIRITGSGQRLVMIYAKDLDGMSFQMWEHGPLHEAMIDRLSDHSMLGVTIDIIGRLNVMVYKSPMTGGRIRRNVFLIEGFKRADDNDSESDLLGNQDTADIQRD